MADMGLDLIPGSIRERFEIDERRHACAILAHDCPTEFADLMGCLKQFKLVRSEIVYPGGDAGMCPVLLVGIKKECYVDDMRRVPVVLTKPTE